MFYCFLATGFEEIEAIATVDILRRAGVEVKTVAVTEGKTLSVQGAHGITFLADILDTDVVRDNMQGVFLPGGMPGTVNLEKSSLVCDYIRYCADNNLYIFAICAAPQVPGHLGVLKGKKATCYPGFEQELLGAEAVDFPAVKDGKVITGKGPGCTFSFALMIVEELCGKDCAQSVAAAMQCHE